MGAFPKGESVVTTIGLPLAIWGTGYAEFLPRWWQGVESLQRQPDQIAIVADANNYQAVLDSIPERYRPICELANLEDYADYWNRAIELCDTEWVAICNVDDLFLSGALDQIDQADEGGYNLVCDTIQDKHDHSLHPSSWRGDIVAHTWTMVGAEPMKKSLWDAAGRFRKGYRFADWALALGMAKSGTVKAFDASTIRIIYDRGHSRVTLSGLMASNEDKARGYEMLRSLAEELGLN